MPKFKKEFYEELRLSFNERSEAYKEFVTEYSTLDASKQRCRGNFCQGLISSDNPIKKIITQHPKLKQTIQSNLKNTDTKTIIPKSKPRDSISR